MFTRREMLTGLAAGAALLATTAVAEDRAVIDARVSIAVDKMYESEPYTRKLAEQAVAMLVMPDVIKGGFLVGGSYGEGALLLRDAGTGYSGPAVGYYSVAAASFGLQVGIQSTSHVLFFMDQDALMKFRRSDGWELGADAEATLVDRGMTADINSTVWERPIIAVVFDRQGALVGASLEGAKYSRIVR